MKEKYLYLFVLSCTSIFVYTTLMMSTKVTNPRPSLEKKRTTFHFVSVIDSHYNDSYDEHVESIRCYANQYKIMHHIIDADVVENVIPKSFHWQNQSLFRAGLLKPSFVNRCGLLNSFVYRRHCLVANLMELYPDGEIFMVFDRGVVATSDFIPLNSNLLKYVEEIPNVIMFYTQCLTMKIEPRNYIVKNSENTRHFLLNWSSRDSSVSRGFASDDEGALLTHLFRFLLNVNDQKEYVQICNDLTGLMNSKFRLNFVGCYRGLLQVNVTGTVEMITNFMLLNGTNAWVHSAVCSNSFRDASSFIYGVKQNEVKYHFNVKCFKPTANVTVGVPAIGRNTKSSIPELLESINHQLVLPSKVLIYLSGVSIFKCKMLEKRWSAILITELNVSCNDKIVSAGVSRRKIAEMASSQIISFVDGDDTMRNNRIEVISSLFKIFPVKVVLHTWQSAPHVPEGKYMLDGLDLYQLANASEGKRLWVYSRAAHGHVSVLKTVFSDVMFKDVYAEDSVFVRDSIMFYGASPSATIFIDKPLTHYIPSAQGRNDDYSYADWKLIINTDVVGYDVGTFNGSVDLSKQICINNVDCHGFVYHNNIAYFKTSTQIQIRRNDHSLFSLDKFNMDIHSMYHSF